MDPSTLILATFPEARDLILYAEDDENIEGLERYASKKSKLKPSLKNKMTGSGMKKQM